MKSVFQTLVLARRSMRLMSGEPVTVDDLMPLFEAARWAPSEYNNQPWRFIYLFPDDALWQPLLAQLNGGNQAWVGKAGALIVVLARTQLEYKNKPGLTYLFDTGAACQNMALAAAAQNLAMCVLGGFDNDQVRTLFNVPGEFVIPVVLAIGHPRPGCVLPPGNRKSVSEISWKGKKW